MAMIEEIKDFIEGIKANPRVVIFDEAATKQAIILPLLHLLGWNTHCVDEVIPEFLIENRKVDYSLHDNGHFIFLEVKRIGEDLERYEKQLLEYCFLKGVEFAILTNGTIWWLYLPMKRADWQARKFASLDLSQEDTLHVAQLFVDLLSKGNATTLGNAEAMYRSRSIAETLPRAWNKLITQPALTLLEQFSETAKEMCGYIPAADEVKHFLKENTDRLIIKIEEKRHKTKRHKLESLPGATPIIVALSIAKLLDAIAREYFKTAQHLPEHNDNVTVYSHPDYLLQLTISKSLTSNSDPNQQPMDQIEFVATSKQIVNALERYCVRHSMKNPYTTANFIKLLSKEEKSLKPAGWEIVRREGKATPYYKKIKDDRFIKLRKTLVR